MVAALLQEYADPITITGGEEYKVRSYERAARAVAGYHADASALDLKGLKEIPNVGGAIAEKVLEFFHSGQMAAVEQLRGFGPRTAENIAHGIELLRRGGGRVLISDAMAVAEEVVAGLAALPECVDAAYAGSLRRMRDTIGDMDVLAAARDSTPLMAEFARMPQVAEVIAHGSTKSSIRTEEGLQVDLRVVTPEVWGAAMLYFTGSREHNVRVREIAVRHGLEPADAADDRREDARAAAGGAGAGRRADGAAARHRAQHRTGRRGGLGSRLPGRLRPVRGRVRASTRTCTSSAIRAPGRSGGASRSTSTRTRCSPQRCAPAPHWRSTAFRIGWTCRTSWCSGRSGTE